jgi:hypothetical protein
MKTHPDQREKKTAIHVLAVQQTRHHQGSYGGCNYKISGLKLHYPFLKTIMCELSERSIAVLEPRCRFRRDPFDALVEALNWRIATLPERLL